MFQQMMSFFHQRFKFNWTTFAMNSASECEYLFHQIGAPRWYLQGIFA